MPHNRLFGCGWVKLMPQAMTNVNNGNLVNYNSNINIPHNYMYSNMKLDTTSSVDSALIFLMITSSGFE